MRIEIDPNEKPKKLKCKTPCIGYCSATTLGDSFCVGCYRSFGCVRDWNKFTEHEKVVTLIRSHFNMKMIKEGLDELS